MGEAAKYLFKRVEEMHKIDTKIDERLKEKGSKPKTEKMEKSNN